MNLTHLHLLINHLPIIGSILGGLVLAHALWTKNNQTKIAAFNVLIISSIGAAIAYFTGEEAEEAVENIQGISKNMIEQHDDSAVISMVAMALAGIASIIGLYLTLKNSPLTRNIALITLFLSLISFGFIARTGYLGGQIRHTELNSNNVVNQGEGGESEEGDKD